MRGSAHERSGWGVRTERCDGREKSINSVVLAGDRNRCYRGLGNRSRSGYVCVFNTVRRGQQLRRAPLLGEQLWVKAVGVIVWICHSLRDLLR